MQQKDRSGRSTVPPTGHKKGGDIQGISTASAARGERCLMPWVQGWSKI